VDIFELIKGEMKKVYLADDKPIVIVSSWGKDSSLMTSLAFEMLRDIPP